MIKSTARPTWDTSSYSPEILAFIDEMAARGVRFVETVPGDPTEADIDAINAAEDHEDLLMAQERADMDREEQEYLESLV